MLQSRVKQEENRASGGLDHVHDVYDSPTTVKILSRSAQLEATELLPGFALPLGTLLGPEAPAE